MLQWPMALYCNFYSKVTQTLIKSAQDPRSAHLCLGGGQDGGDGHGGDEQVLLRVHDDCTVVVRLPTRLLTTFDC